MRAEAKARICSSRVSLRGFPDHHPRLRQAVLLWSAFVIGRFLLFVALAGHRECGAFA